MQSVKIREFIPEDRIEDKNTLLPVFIEIWNAPENLKYLSVTLIQFVVERVQMWIDNRKEQGGRYFCTLDDQSNILGVMAVKESPLEATR